MQRFNRTVLTRSLLQLILHFNTVEKGVNRCLSNSPRSHNIYIWMICVYLHDFLDKSMKWHRWNIQKYFLYLAYRDSPLTTHSLHRSDSRWQITSCQRLLKPELHDVFFSFFFSLVTRPEKGDISTSTGYFGQSYSVHPSYSNSWNYTAIFKFLPPVSQIKQMRWKQWQQGTKIVWYHMIMNTNDYNAKIQIRSDKINKQKHVQIH